MRDGLVGRNKINILTCRRYILLMHRIVCCSIDSCIQLYNLSVTVNNEPFFQMLHHVLRMYMRCRLLCIFTKVC